MNKLLCLFIFISLSLTAYTYAADKIAVVNVSSVFQQSSQRAIVAKKLEKEFKIRTSELQVMEQDLQKKMQYLKRDGSVMKANERSALEKSVIAQREAFSNKAQAFEKEHNLRQTDERNKILNNIQKAVNSVANKEGYDVVIDANAVAYAKSSKDITIDVLKKVK